MRSELAHIYQTLLDYVERHNSPVTLVEDVDTNTGIDVNFERVKHNTARDYNYEFSYSGVKLSIDFTTDHTVFNISEAEVSYGSDNFKYSIDYQGCTLEPTGHYDHKQIEAAIECIVRLVLDFTLRYGEK